MLCKICKESRYFHTHLLGYCTDMHRIGYTDDDQYTPMTNLEFLEYKLALKEKV
jgi:hypothetical protein